jgi:hypothetical protein
MERSALAGSDTNDAKEGSGQRFPPQAKPPAPTHPLQLGTRDTFRVGTPGCARHVAPDGADTRCGPPALLRCCRPPQAVSRLQIAGCDMQRASVAGACQFPGQQCVRLLVLASPGDDPLQDIGEIGKRLNTVLGAEHPSHRLSNARLANSGVPWCTYRSIVVAGYPSTASTALSFLRLH